ncbi:MAG: hypothetical protein QW667_04680 [Candidatus Bathyarchaeia archaeon]
MDKKIVMVGSFAFIILVVGLLGDSPIRAIINREPQQPPPDHVSLVKRIKVYYPWKNLEPKFVFIGQEYIVYDGAPMVCIQTVWVWLYIDQRTVDVACVMIISSRPTFYALEFSRMDSGMDAEQNLTVEIDGKIHQHFWVYAEKGYRADISVPKQP